MQFVIVHRKLTDLLLSVFSTNLIDTFTTQAGLNKVALRYLVTGKDFV